MQTKLTQQERQHIPSIVNNQVPGTLGLGNAGVIGGGLLGTGLGLYAAKGLSDTLGVTSTAGNIGLGLLGAGLGLGAGTYLGQKLTDLHKGYLPLSGSERLTNTLVGAGLGGLTGVNVGAHIIGKSTDSALLGGALGAATGAYAGLMLPRGMKKIDPRVLEVIEKEGSNRINLNRYLLEKQASLYRRQNLLNKYAYGAENLGPMAAGGSFRGSLRRRPWGIPGV